ncbi:MAG TPA: sugar transferase [Pseudolabrys sp.]|nr:sugar transferase [Pseudolabrys sp.]
MSLELSGTLDRLHRYVPSSREIRTRLAGSVPQDRRKRVYHRSQRTALREPTALTLACKRMLDICGAGVGLLLFAPLLVAIAVAIKLTSPGPVFFRQKRYGYHNRRFRIFKFRTMYVDRSDERGVEQTKADDSRVTPLGRILRKTSLDELPQLINVLKGDMSLVGPRPHVPGMLANGMLYETFIPYYFARHNMKPGLTGLAQVRGFRGSTTDPAAALARVDCDLEYIECWSLRRDFAIIFQTVIKEFFLSGSGI